MDAQSLVSVIIITRNRPQYLKECLSYLKKQDYGNFEVVVVDSSTDDETQRVTKDYSNTRYLRYINGKNMAISRNMGIVNSSGNIVVFIDDDSIVYDRWLRELVSCYTNDQIGGAGGRVISGHMDDGAGIDGSKVGRIWPSGLMSSFHWVDTKRPVSVDYLVGCNMSFRRSVLEKLGGFDPVFKVFNDIDICMRVKKSGYEIIFSPKAVVFHSLAPQELISRKNKDPKSYFYKERNHFYMMLKNSGFKMRFFKAFFYWNTLEFLKHSIGNLSMKSLTLLFASGLGKVSGLFLALKTKIIGERNHLVDIKIKCITLK